MRSLVRVAVIVLGIGAVLAPVIGEERVTLNLLLDRAAWYLDYFIDQFENVVAEENYMQDSSVLLPSFSPFTGRGGLATAPPWRPTSLARATAISDRIFSS